MRNPVALAIALLCVLAGIAPAEARRVALVIGNADYKLGRLANPLNDAEAMAEALQRQLKFDTVLLRKNLSLDGFRAALRELAGLSRGAELGLIYFAGHGIETGGRNYLIPIDAGLAAPSDVDLEAIALDTVLGQLDGVTRLRLVILDACRNNPFPAARRGARGLGRIEPVGGTLVAYAAKDGTAAEDGKGRHSPFTAALLKRIVTPGLDVRRMFGYVSEDVLAATSRAQEPYLYGRLGGDELHLLPQAPAASGAAPPSPSGEAAAAWAAVRDTASIAQLEVIAKRYEGTVYADLARARIGELKDRQKLVLAAPPAPPPKPESGASFNPLRAAVPLTAAEERALKPGDSFRECSDCPEMVVVPAGSFMMGSPPEEDDRTGAEGPQRRVTIARPFAVGRLEVTFAEWDACVAEQACAHTPSDLKWGRGKRPAIDVSWNDITEEFLPWLSRKTGKSYRLLTEAEWEHAARAGTSTRYAFGDKIGKTQAQFSEGSWGRAGKTMPAGAFPPNAFGLHDMHGNVWEWVQDCWNDTYDGAPLDGAAWAAGDCDRRVARGGSWYVYARDLRSAYRVSEPSDNRDQNMGFRVARTL